MIVKWLIWWPTSITLVGWLPWWVIEYYWYDVGQLTTMMVYWLSRWPIDTTSVDWLSWWSIDYHGGQSTIMMSFRQHIGRLIIMMVDWLPWWLPCRAIDYCNDRSTTTTINQALDSWSLGSSIYHYIPNSSDILFIDEKLNTTLVQL